MVQQHAALVLPATIATTFRAASYIDVRAAVQAKQLVDGYKTMDRIVVATSEGMFICIPSTGEMARYVAWDRIHDVHWYPALKVAAMLCPDDGFDVVLSAVEAPSLLKGGSAVDASAPASDETGQQRVGDTAPAAETNASVPSVPERALRTIAERTTRAFQRVRSSTVNLGKRPTASASPTTMELADLTVKRGGGAYANGNDPSATTNLTNAAHHLPTTASPTSPTSSSSSFVPIHGQLPVPVTPPSTLFEFVSWASALSQSRAYHGIVPSMFVVSVLPGEHLNAWQRYAVRRPEGYSMRMPSVQTVFESAHATDAHREAVVRRYHLNDRLSAQDVRRAALRGAHSVEDLDAGAAHALQEPSSSSVDGLDCDNDDDATASDDDQGALPPSDTRVASKGVAPTPGAAPSGSVGGRKRGQTMFCSAGPSGPTSCNEGSFSIGGRAVSAFCTGNGSLGGKWLPANGAGEPYVGQVGQQRRGQRCGAACKGDDDDGDGDDDAFVVVDNPDLRNWNTSPLDDLPPEGKNEWWRRQCTALARENRELRQEAEELRLRLSLLQHQGTNGTTTSVYGTNSLGGGVGNASATRRHRLPF